MSAGPGTPGHDPFLESIEDTDHSTHDDGESAWIVSYADMMTLLFGFFAMLFTFASFEDEDTVKVNRELAKYFGGTFISSSTSPKELTAEMEQKMRMSPYSRELTLKEASGGVEISFITSLLFPSGNADLTPETARPIAALGEVIKSTGKKFKILVEGHTDDNPISGRFPSNWELSAARAASIVRYFQKMGFPPETLSATGYGDSRPIYPNRDPAGVAIPENQTRNRRVVIKVLPDTSAAPSPVPAADSPKSP